MKKIILLLVFSILITGAFSAPYKFLPHKVTQPNGTVIECYLSGDEFFVCLAGKPFRQLER